MTCDWKARVQCTVKETVEIDIDIESVDKPETSTETIQPPTTMEAITQPAISSERPVLSQLTTESSTIQSELPTATPNQPTNPQTSSSSNNPEISLKPTRPTTTVSSTTQSTTGPTTRPRPTTTTTKRPSTSTTQTAVIPPIVVNPIKPGSGSSVTNTGNSQLYH